MTTVRFVLPPSWSTLATTDLSQLSCDADTVGEALTWLADQHPALEERIFQPDSDTPRLAPWTIVCLDHVHIYDPGTPIPDGATEIQIIPALVGG